MIRVDRAAIKTGEGVVMSLPAPASHAAVLEDAARSGVDCREGEMGFLLSDGRFVTRGEAGKVALAAGQCARLSMPPYLDTDDLW